MRRRHVEQLHAIEEALARLQLLLTVREPTVGLAAEAYEGLRRQVVVSAGQRNAHLAQLARLDAELQRDASGESMKLLLRDLLNEADLVRIAEPSAEDFDILDGKGDALEVLEPAYFDAQARRIVRRGKARRCDAVLETISARRGDVDAEPLERTTVDAQVGGQDQ